MNHPFLHEARLGQCRYILGTRPWQLNARSVAVDLAIICAEAVPAEGAAWCTVHAAALTRPSPRIAAPVERMRITRPPAEEAPEPDLCALVAGDA